ncbi:hypothetical protein J7T55_010168 [Diaporthe amygdali]|uniref:uncharacterized protein n=1 Tax=Phomopsis amygdali TaxID=1214568 RepID=UPI0022FDF51D|nr:uncharacterized protein J7T55_010168 [Diaporthe amygdali]KAJ0113924.1 hypothetical protein J7T55_010168 [Diaporthe amygdali]
MVAGWLPHLRGVFAFGSGPGPFRQWQSVDSGIGTGTGAGTGAGTGMTLAYRLDKREDQALLHIISRQKLNECS